jgi:hypothetical protein
MNYPEQLFIYGIYVQSVKRKREKYLNNLPIACGKRAVKISGRFFKKIEIVFFWIGYFIRVKNRIAFF